MTDLTQISRDKRAMGRQHLPKMQGLMMAAYIAGYGATTARAARAEMLSALGADKVKRIKDRLIALDNVLDTLGPAVWVAAKHGAVFMYHWMQQSGAGLARIAALAEAGEIEATIDLEFVGRARLLLAALRGG